MLFWLPIPLGSYRPWAILLFSAFIGILFLLHIGLVFKQKIALFPPKYSAWILACLLVVISVLCIQLIPIVNSDGIYNTVTISLDIVSTQTTLFKTISMLLFCWLIFSYCESKEKLRKICIAIVAGGLFQALYATYLNLNPEILSTVFNYAYEKRAAGSFTYQNFLANYLALCLSIGIGVLISELSLSPASKTFRGKTRDLFNILLSSKIILRGALILMIIGLILTRSRMGNSAFFFAIAAVSIFAFFFYKQKPRNLRLLIISFFIIDILIVGAFFGIDKVKERLVETSLSSETRDEVVRDSIPIIKDNLWLGTGGGTFYTAFAAHQPESYSGYYDNAHNDYIQFAVEFGVPTTLLLGGLVLFTLFTALKTMVKRKTPLFQGVAFGGAVAIIHMILHATVDYSLQAGANSFTFMIILCLVFISANISRKVRRVRERG